MKRPLARISSLALLLLPAAGAAQTGGLPPSAILTNYDRVLIGQEEALESGAYAARVGDTTSGWYNPAGLARVQRSIIGASATGYELDIIDLGAIQTSSGRVTLAQLPSFFGAVLGSDVLHSDAWRIGFTATKPTSWSAAVNGATLDGNRVTYSSKVNISTLVPTISAAWAPREDLRFGAGLGVAITSISQTQILSERGPDLTDQTALASLTTVDANGVTWGLQATLGFQWDITDQFVVGGSLATPTLQILESGSIAYQAMEQTVQGVPPTPQPWNQAYFRDPNATFAYHLPLTVNVGVAWRHKKFEAEVDVRYHSRVSQYTLLGSSQKVEVVSTDPATGQPVHSFSNFGGLAYGASTVWNVAAGGHYKLDESWSFHGGFYTDFAPTDPQATELFRTVNLFGATLGAKLKGSHLSGSLGLGFSWGDSDNFPLGAPGGPGVVTTRLSIRSVSLLYAIAYSF
jgi:long-subunit fatty acid transport protein